MAKIFYTDRDIEDLAKQGVDSIVVNENVILTDLALEKARSLEIALVSEKESQSQSPSKSDVAAKKITSSISPVLDSGIEERVYKAIKSRFGDQVDDALLRTIVKRVIQSLGNR